MTRDDLAIIGCRIIALGTAAFALLGVPYIPSRIQAYRDTFEGVSIAWSIAGIVGGTIDALVGAFLLWVLAPRLVRLALRRVGELMHQVDIIPVVSIGLFLVGINTLIGVFSDAPTLLWYLQPMPKAELGGDTQDGVRDLLDAFSSRPSAIPEIARQSVLVGIGAILIFCAPHAGALYGRLTLTSEERQEVQE